MAALPSDGDAARSSLYRTGDQCGGRANQNIGKRRRRFHRRGNGRDLAKLLRQPVHFPVPGNQRPHVFLIADAPPQTEEFKWLDPSSIGDSRVTG